MSERKSTTMIYHVVLIQLKPDTPEDKITAAIQALEALPAKIPVLKHLKAGKNFSERSAGYGLLLVSTFENKADLDTYLAHPAHVQVVNENISPIMEGVAVGDMTFTP